MLRNVFSNWAAFVLIGLLSFLLTPFMIHRLGDFEFGIYTLAFSVAGYTDLLEQGIRSTLQRFVGRLSGMRDREALNSVFSTALALTLVICSLTIVLCLGLSRVLPAFFKLGPAQRDLFASLVIILGLNIGLGFPAALLGSYLTGLQRFDLYNLVMIARQGLRALLILVVLLRGEQVVAVAWSVLVSTLVLVPLNWWMIRRVDPGLKLRRRLIRLRTARELLGFSFWTLLNNAGQFLRDSTDSIVIGRVLGAALITPFIVASRLVDYFRPVIRDMVSPLLPRISELDGQGRQEEIRQLFLRMTRLSALASLSIAALLLLHGRTLLLLWVGPRFISSYPILVLLTVGAVASLAQFGTAPLLIALGRHRVYGVWTLGEGLANLVLSVIWARQYGIVGVALGTAVPLLAVKLTLQPWYVTRVLRMSIAEYVSKALLRPLMVSAGFFGFCSLLGGLQAHPGLWRLIWNLAWQGTLLAALSFAIGLEASEREEFRQKARRFASPSHWAKAFSNLSAASLLQVSTPADRTARRELGGR